MRVRYQRWSGEQEPFPLDVSAEDVLDEFLDRAPEIRAQLVEHVCLDVRPVMVDQLGERHAAQSRGCRNLLQLHRIAPPDLDQEQERSERVSGLLRDHGCLDDSA